MLITVLLVAVAPALLILGLGIAVRAVAAQHVTPRVVQYSPERDSTVLRDALLVNADRRAMSAALIDLAVKRKLRLVADGAKRATVSAELAPNAVLTAQEVAVLEVLFGPEHTGKRLRRFSADRRALRGRVRTLLQNTEHALARDGLVARDRVTWPGTTLTVLAYLGMFVEAIFLVVTLMAGDWTAHVATLGALAATIATIFVTPASWRRFLPPAVPKREHLEGLRQYLELAEADRMRMLQSPSGAELRPVGAATTTDAAVPPTSAPDGAAELPEPVLRFHLHERLLPYAVLFGVEREWIRQLEIEQATLEASNLDTLADLVSITADLAVLLAAAGSVVELAASVGDLVDSGGRVLEGIGDLFDALNA